MNLYNSPGARRRPSLEPGNFLPLSPATLPIKSIFKRRAWRVRRAYHGPRISCSTQAAPTRRRRRRIRELAPLQHARLRLRQARAQRTHPAPAPTPRRHCSPDPVLCDRRRPRPGPRAIPPRATTGRRAHLPIPIHPEETRVPKRLKRNHPWIDQNGRPRIPLLHHGRAFELDPKAARSLQHSPEHSPGRPPSPRSLVLSFARSSPRPSTATSTTQKRTSTPCAAASSPEDSSARWASA